MPIDDVNETPVPPTPGPDPIPGGPPLPDPVPPNPGPSPGPPDPPGKPLPI